MTNHQKNLQMYDEYLQLKQELRNYHWSKTIYPDPCSYKNSKIIELFI